MTRELTQLSVKIFADGANRPDMLEMYKQPFIKGFTTNPTLMRNAGITDYRVFAQAILKEISDLPISFEVFSDEFSEMEKQALEIASWGDNVYVKIPITNTHGESSRDLISTLTRLGVKLNITAVMTIQQVTHILPSLLPHVPSYISIFAGRIADTGCDPIPIMREALELLKPYPLSELIWASPRELLNIFQADTIGCHVITVTGDILKKLALVSKNLEEYSLETVKMFYEDAVKAKYTLG